MSNGDPVGNVSDPIDDLLSEKSLWQIFRKSLAIPYSRINIAGSMCIGGIAFLLHGLYGNTKSNLDLLYLISSLSFNSTVSLLGFLLAGFTFFATVADKRMFCFMAENHHALTGMSYLKWSLFVFMRVFVEYLTGCVLSLIVCVLVAPDNPVRLVAQSALDSTANRCYPRLPSWLSAIAVGLGVSGVVYLLGQLKSFIFNIYHVVVVGISWEMEHKRLSKGEEVDS